MVMAEAQVVAPQASNGTAATMNPTSSISEQSQTSQTAQEFISSQLQLEADAREALPYQFDSCTQPLGPLRQLLFSCITCNPPPSSPSEPYTPAGLCYSCSISCHGEHTLVELFNKRNFVCDCGTTRIQSSMPCTLRINQETGMKGGVAEEKPEVGNKYNQNFANRFCGCGEDYNAHEEKGTMFQCLGLGTVEHGGCGEDWWHPECLMGVPRRWYETPRADGIKDPEKTHPQIGDDTATSPNVRVNPQEHPNGESNNVVHEEHGVNSDAPVPLGFPDEDEFEHLICYKCIDANPWLKRYANARGLLSAPTRPRSIAAPLSNITTSASPVEPATGSKKRKADEDDELTESSNAKRQRSAETEAIAPASGSPPVVDAANKCKYAQLPEAPSEQLSLFVPEDFRERFCRCADCFPRLKPFPQLLEEEETYEPPISEDGDDGTGIQSVGTGSLLERGEAALSNVDRVRAIEGVMVYNHLKDKVKSFLQPFADSGQAVGAEDIKSYFEKLRGDAEAMKAAAMDAQGGSGGGESDNRREQGGY